MSTLEPATDKLIVQRGSDLYTTTIDNMSTIQDDDLVMIGRGSESYKMNGKEFKEQAGGGGLTPPEIFNVSLAGSGPGFSGETYTTTVNYNPGNPAASLDLKAKVSGALSIAGETSPITNVAGGDPISGLSATVGDGSLNNGSIFDQTVYTNFCRQNRKSQGFTFTGLNVQAGDKIKIYGQSGGDRPVFLEIAGVEYEITLPAGSWSNEGSYGFSNEITVTTSGAFTNFYCNMGNTISDPGGDASCGAIYVNGEQIFNGQIADTILTLTDRTNLDNGAFVVGDVVTGYTGSDAAGPLVSSATLYTGTGTTQKIVTGFAPDLVWVKNRDGATNNHVLFDTLRGPGERLYSDNAGAQGYEEYSLVSFDSDGFTLGGHSSTNPDGQDWVAWCWQAGPQSSNGDGSISSTVRAGNGFSVLRYSGNGNDTATVGHDLGQKPDMIILKGINNQNDWKVMHSYADWAGDPYYENVLALNKTGTYGGFEGYGNGYPWGGEEPTDTVFTVANSGDANRNGNDSNTNYIAYCFAETPGISKFGRYTGTNDGPVIDCGFEPGIILIKCISTSTDWLLYDNKRDTPPTWNNPLFPNGVGIEQPGTGYNLDVYSDSFQPRGAATNTVGEEYIYAVFAEGDPPVTVEGISTTAAEMTVSGGDWVNGQTVKNTVVNPITGKPVSDEIVGIDSSEASISDTAGITQLYIQDLNDIVINTNSPSPSQILIVNDYPLIWNDSNPNTNINGSGQAAQLYLNGTVAYKCSGSAPFKLLTSSGYGSGQPYTYTIAGDVTVSGTTGGSAGRADQTKDEVTITPNSEGAVFSISTNGTSFFINYLPLVGGGTVLTLASNKDLGNFASGYDVYQDSGYSAETSAITNVVPTLGPVPNAGSRQTVDITTFMTANGITGITGFRMNFVQGFTNGFYAFTTNGITYAQGNSLVITQETGTAYPDGSYSWTNWANSTNPIVQYKTDTTVRFNEIVVGGTTTVDVQDYADKSDNNVWVVDQDGNEWQLYGASTTLTLTDSTDLDVFEPGDVVAEQGSPYTSLVYKQPNDEDIGTYFNFFGTAGTLDSSGWTILDFVDQSTIGTTFTFSYFESDNGTLFIKKGNYNSTEVVGSSTATYGAFTIYGGNEGVGEAQISLTGLTHAGTMGTLPEENPFLEPVKVVSVGPGNTMKVDGGTWSNGDTVSCTYQAGTGTVGSTSGSTMTLSSADNAYPKRWVPNHGKFVTGDPTPIQVQTAYLDFDSGTGVVENVQSSDPGYKPSPPNNALIFTDPMTGQTWNDELPAGTSIETRVKAQNDSGSSESNWTAPVTPRALTVDMTAQELEAAYIEAALLFATFDNRHKVHCGNIAEQQRDELIAKLAAAGYSLTKVLSYL